MTKQEFLAMSLPHGLKCKDSNPLEPSGMFKYIGIFYQEDYGSKYKNVKPIIRPLSDLIKPIEHNGEKFVPIVELAKMSWIDEIVNFKYQSLKEETVFIAFSDKYNVFGYDLNTRSFFGATDGESCSVINQLSLFENMIEWHFDIAGLIEKGEAIDVNTLPENPYK